MRLFVAICFEEKVKNDLFSLEEKVKTYSCGNFVPKENLHLTLTFIGETKRSEEIKTALSKIKIPEFSIKLSKFGTFENSVFWIGTEKNKALENLNDEILKSLEGLEFNLEKREFIPHITLARKFSNTEMPFNEIEKEIPKYEIKVESISLMRSDKTEKGVSYTEIFSKRLEERSGKNG